MYTFFRFYDKLTMKASLIPLPVLERAQRGILFMLKTKELPENERPYEKCEKYGAQALSDAVLLAVIIRTGTKTKTGQS